ncbi:MAG TPA: hypothetical protein VMG30_03260 [Acidobacteriota bacterium]|nr:hypothetical protein [Acidobacteriota bacterium]
MAFNLKRLLTGVFEVQPGEEVVVACDVPHGALTDSAAWQERREMAAEWRAAFDAMAGNGGFTVLPLFEYPATGMHGADLPVEGTLGGDPAETDAVLLSATLAVFITQYSATAALDGYCRRKEDFRAASLPGLERRMENTALDADYREVARRCRILDEAMRGAEELRVRFSSGESCRFDLRFRKPEVDDGYLPRFKPGDRVINLPSGETFIVPYEGERPGDPSHTAGELPVDIAGEHVVLEVAKNRILRVRGEGAGATHFREIFAADPVRANIAEVAFGCNDSAVVTGSVLEDEKAGFHWAYGRSDHLGGSVGVAAFLRPDTVVHQDTVYAKGNPIQVAEATVIGPRGEVTIIHNGTYVVF